MTDIATLNNQFGIPNVATVDAGSGGLPRVRVTSPVAEAEIYLHGGHVTRWTPRGHKPVLFMSNESLFDPAKAIRGGVPVIFPWFGPSATNPKAPQHGFARTTPWTLRGIRTGADAATAVELGLASTDTSRGHWPHNFDATFTVTAGKTLDMALEVVNKSQAEFTFEEALHTYLAVGDIRQTSIDGLAGREYLDKVDKAARKKQASGAFTLSGETDRVYL